jgi:SAM-dependent methyltransferase
MAAQYGTDANLAARQSIYRYRRGGAPGSFFDEVLDLAGVRGGEAVADIGCGNGLYLRALARRGHAGPIVGLDLSPGMAIAASAHGPAVAADAQLVPLRSASVDVALCPHMLYHVPDQGAAVAELRRVLRPGGRAVVVTNSVEHFREVDDLVADIVGSRPMRLLLAFTMEGGEAVLRSSFPAVERHDWRGALDVTDAGAVVDYVASLRGFYGIDDAALDEVRRRVEAVIERDGVFVVSTASGAFRCSSPDGAAPR